MDVITATNDVSACELCDALSVPRATYYRNRFQRGSARPKAKPGRPPLALTTEERQRVLDVLHSEQYAEKAPPVVYAELLSQGQYVGSVRTMYRILAANAEIKERRDQLRHPVYEKPELLATAPNQVWSWDITKLKGEAAWTYYYLYVIMDIFSRRVVGWLIADAESTTLAKQLVGEAYHREGVEPTVLTLHADRGSAMKSKALGQFLADLGITKTHSRPHVSNDNPFSEAQFKTMKYCPKFPKRFGCIQDATAFCREFFRWYNEDHQHSGIGFIAPNDLHYGRADIIASKRQATLDDAFAENPTRFKGQRPTPPRPPKEAWINKPKPENRLH